MPGIDDEFGYNATLPADGRKIKAVDGPYRHGEGWQILLTYVDGSKTTRAYPTEQGAKSAVGRMKKRMELHSKTDSARKKTDIPDYDGTLSWWVRIMAQLAIEVVAGEDKDVRNDLKAIASAAMSAQKLYDTTEAEKRLAELEARFAEMSRARTHGIGPTGSDQSAGRAYEPEQPLH